MKIAGARTPCDTPAIFQILFRGELLAGAHRAIQPAVIDSIFVVP